MSDLSKRKCLSVVMPCFNEEKTVRECIEAVLQSALVFELIVVDDGSTDGTRNILQTIVDPRVKVILQPRNQGKGSALKTGFAAATGEYVIVQDADLEYEPSDFVRIVQPLEAGKADVVYGSRFAGGEAHRVVYFWHMVGNKLLTLLSNMFTNLNLTDMETCYKCFRREVLQSIDLKEQRFGIEPELTGKIASGRWRVYEVGISYNGRTYEEGKKIGWKDGFRALVCIVKYSPVLERRRGR